jgi:hypothetical protein
MMVVGLFSTFPEVRVGTSKTKNLSAGDTQFGIFASWFLCKHFPDD